LAESELDVEAALLVLLLDADEEAPWALEPVPDES
jgi:hypothetical protein